MTDRETVARAIAEAEGDQPWNEPKPRHYRAADAAIAALRPEAQDGVAAAALRDAVSETAARLEQVDYDTRNLPPEMEGLSAYECGELASFLRRALSQGGK